MAIHMERFESFVGWYNDKLVGIWTLTFKNIAELALVFTVLMITVYVILRRFTEIRIYFVEEWSAFLVVLIAYFSITYALRHGSHIIVEMVVRRFSHKTRRILEFIMGLISVVVVSYLLLLSIKFFIYNWESGVMTQNVNPTPMWIPSLFVPFGLTLFALALLGYTMQRLVELVHIARGKYEEAVSEKTERQAAEWD